MRLDNIKKAAYVKFMLGMNILPIFLPSVGFVALILPRNWGLLDLIIESNLFAHSLNRSFLLLIGRYQSKSELLILILLSI